MEVILHFGMPKTGSSSIQETFATAPPPGLATLPWPQANHAAFVVAFFEDAPERHPAFAHRPDPAGAVAAMRAEWEPRIEAAFANPDIGRILISAERLYNTPRPALRRLADWLDARAQRVTVVGYVRPPVAFSASALVQNIRAGTGGRRVAEVWPVYRAKIGKFDDVFGRDRVRLFPFRPERMPGGDVTADFAARIGVALDPARIRRVNESLCREAAALIHAWDRTRPKREGAAARSARARLVRALQGLKGDRLELGPALVAPLLARHAADLDWIADRLGEPLADAASEAPDALSSEDDLMHIAAGAADRMGELALAAAGRGAGLERVARLLDALMAAQATAAAHQTGV